MERYDLAVLGTGPAGHFGAIQAAKLGKRVAAIEKMDRTGGVSAITGTIPSKSLREAALHLTGQRQRLFYGMNYRVKQDLTPEDLTRSTDQIIGHETGVLEAQLRRNNVQIIRGTASFIGPHELKIQDGDVVRVIAADRILIAVGTRPAHPDGVDFDGTHIIDSNQILHLPTIPNQLIVVGAGVIGVEYACVFATLGVHVTLVNTHEDFLEFVDREIIDHLKYHMQRRNVDLRLGERVVDIRVDGDRVIASTASNKRMGANCLLYSIGRQGNTDQLNLDATGLTADRRGRIKVNEHFQSDVPHIYAAGDVIGFPALAATSREQGRSAVCHAFDVEKEPSPAAFPYGIYAIPEISMVGATEKELTEQGVPYEVGRARYCEIARGHILGDLEGMLKLVFHRETRQILGVHIIGEGAAELVHIGQLAEAMGATIDYFVDAVFNFPTLAECYKVAALDGINRVRLVEGGSTDVGRIATVVPFRRAA